MNRLFPYILIIISSSIIALTRYPMPIVSLLIFVAYIPLYHFLIQNHSFKEIVISGALFGGFYNLIALHWIALVTLPGYLGMFLLFTIYFSVLFLFINKVSKRFKRIKPLIFILFFISFEYLQNFGEFSFPWFNTAYSLAEHLTLIQIADIGGVFFVSFMVLIVNLLIYHLLTKFDIYKLLSILIIFLIWFSYGKYRLHTLKMYETDTDISVIQGNIPLDLKWQKSFMDSSLSIYKNLTLKSKNNSSLFVWPESAVTYYLLKDYRIKHNLSNFAIKNKVNIFTGFQDYKPAPGENPEGYNFYNAASQINKNGIIEKPYYKINLVPFGERMPFLKIFPILWKIQMGQANFERGKQLTTFKLDNNYKYSSVICFEIAFPLFIRKFASQNIDFLVNLTNDAWFHRSVGTYQHAMMTKFRAIEIRKQIFRAANTGYSLIVLPTGEILKSTDLYQRTFIHSHLFLCKEKTLFTKILYLFPFVLLLLSGVIFVIYLKKIMIG